MVSTSWLISDATALFGLRPAHQVCIIQEPPAISQPSLQAPANRVSTLTPASIQLLTNLGAWPDIAPPRSAPFSRMQVWDSLGQSFVQYDASHLSEPSMGHVAENGVVQHALMQRLRPNVNRMWPVSVPCRACDRWNCGTLPVHQTCCILHHPCPLKSVFNTGCICNPGTSFH